MTNFRNGFSENTKEEMLEILTALLSEKKVYFYWWDSRTEAMRVGEIIPGCLPVFDKYHYSLDNSKLRTKVSLTFIPETFVPSVVKRVEYDTHRVLPGAHVLSWFRPDGTLVLEQLPGAKVVWQSSDPLPVQKQEEKGILSLLKDSPANPDVHKIWLRETKRLKYFTTPYRTFQHAYHRIDRSRVKYQYVSSRSYDLYDVESIRVVIRFDEGVAVSKNCVELRKLHGMKVSTSMRRYDRIAADSNARLSNGDIITINGIEFDFYVS